MKLICCRKSRKKNLCGTLKTNKRHQTKAKKKTIKKSRSFDSEMEEKIVSYFDI